MDQRESKIAEGGKLEDGNAEAASEAREDASLPREAYALLAQANLLRVRGHWNDAAEKCMAALRLAPDSASANSLLGDIYENQGRYDDAALWYRMALDANPDSPADHLKLNRLSRRDGELPASPRVKPARFLAHLRADPEFALRCGAIAAALGLFIIVACAYRVAHRTGAFQKLGLSGDVVVSTKPVVVPPRAGALPADPDGKTARDPSEQALLTSLQGASELARLGVSVYDVQVDPRVSRITVTFGLPAAPGMTQGQVTQAALGVLQAAAAGQSADMFTARCLLAPSGGTAAALLFAGDISRDALQSASPAVFSNTWWSATADVRA